MFCSLIATLSIGEICLPTEIVIRHLISSFRTFFINCVVELWYISPRQRLRHMRVSVHCLAALKILIWTLSIHLGNLSIDVTTYLPKALSFAISLMHTTSFKLPLLSRVLTGVLAGRILQGVDSLK